MAENHSPPFTPHGIFQRFKTTSDTIFRDEGPDSLPRRMARCFEKYLPSLVDYLQEKLKLDRMTAEETTIEFIERLFMTPAIRRPAWGLFRVYLAKSLYHFALRKMKREDRRRHSLRVYATQVADFVMDDLLGLELRQIRRALEDGVIDECLKRGVELDEISQRDVLIWNLAVREHKTFDTIARCSDVNVDKSTISRTLPKVEAYFRRHSCEIRSILSKL